MRRATRVEIAPWVHTLTLAGAIAAIASTLHIPATAWLLEHPEVLGPAVAVLSRVLGIGVSRLPHFQGTDRSHHMTVDRVHRRIESVIDSLAYIQAECDTAADAAEQARKTAQRHFPGA